MDICIYMHIHAHTSTHAHTPLREAPLSLTALFAVWRILTHACMELRQGCEAGMAMCRSSHTDQQLLLLIFTYLDTLRAHMDR